MLARLLLAALDRPSEHALSALVHRIAREFPAVEPAIAGGGASERGAPAHVGPASLWVAASDWSAPSFDFYAFDARLNALAALGPFTLGVVGESAALARAPLEILTRSQRLCPLRNDASRSAVFDGLLARHRALHDLDKPLVRADHDHALDTWQWALRLAPSAGLAVQAAALFHDVERLVSEPDARVEHRAADYQAFKDAHAAEGARMARSALAEAGLPPDEVERAARLIAVHERPSGDRDVELLNDADALSFFSLNSGGYMDYFGPEQTRRKIGYTLSRLGPASRRWLAGVRLRHDVAALVEAFR